MRVILFPGQRNSWTRVKPRLSSVGLRSAKCGRPHWRTYSHGRFLLGNMLSSIARHFGSCALHQFSFGGFFVVGVSEGCAHFKYAAVSAAAIADSIRERLSSSRSSCSFSPFLLIVTSLRLCSPNSSGLVDPIHPHAAS